MRELIDHKANQFLTNADMCRHLGQSLNHENRALLFGMAEQWEVMAQHVLTMPSIPARGIAEPGVIPFRVNRRKGDGPVRPHS
jgi:hypothetical protein